MGCRQVEQSKNELYMNDRVGPITLGKRLDEALKKERWVAFAERSFGPSTVYDPKYVDFQMESA